MRALAVILWALVLAAIGIPPVQAAQRVALVIGNAAYRHAPALNNPRNDAEDIARSLRDLGFETFVATDLDRAGMNDALDRFSRIVVGAEIALVYYSGHGMQFAGKNFLLPVDARLASAEDVNKFRLMPLDDVFEILLPAQRRVVVLDACRNNPVEEDLKRRLASIPGANRDAYLSRGLGRIPTGNGLIVAYSTQANDVAGDGLGRNSPFTAAFLKHVGTPDVDIRQMLIRVQDDVDRQTSGRQRPELSLSPIREFKLKVSVSAHQTVPPPQSETRPAPAQPTSHAPTFDGRAMELSFWESVRASTSPALIQTYLDRYPNGTFAALAKARIQELQKPQSPPPPQQAPPRQSVTIAAPPPFHSLVPRTNQQPSIDCARPNEPIEHLICADAELAEWDGRMGRIYNAKRDDGRSRDSFRKLQLTWIERRNAQCGVPKGGNWSIVQLAPLKPCILRMTKERVNELASK